MIKQLAVDLRLQPFTGTLINRQGRRGGFLGQAVFIAGQETNDVRFFDSAVGIDGAGFLR